ncbi:MAG: gamma carbonic anhydrase family protein, partial [Cyclobacteriaceae bacterium]|nr:gamma carbonic anhydrase family protein [Cyclobacteriaceae bacterium]
MALIKTVRGKTPVYGEGCFFAENATLIGDIMLGDNCSVWFNTVVRGDVNSIHVGNSTNIQDGAVIHGTYKLAKTVIGNSVSIGHNALIHGCTIKDHVLIGMGAIVMDNAIIGPYSLIAAGSVVLAETVIPARSVYAGIPARKVKDIDDR